MDAAIAVMDREGVDGLSMRRVAEELDTGAASLYWHVKNKDELLQLIFERTAQEVTLPTPIRRDGRNRCARSRTTCAT